MKVFPSIFQKSDAILILIYLVVELAFLNVLPDIMIDEPWYGNTAYNFVQSLYFTNTNVGFSGGDLFCFSNIILAGFYKLFGFSITVSRLSSVLGGLVCLIGLIRLLRIIKIKEAIIILTGLLLIFSNVFYIISRTTRPEVWVLALCIWAVYYSLKFYDNRKIKYSILAGLFAGLGLLCHPNGILAVIDSGIIMIIAVFNNKRFVHLFYFGFTFLIALGIPFLYCLSNPNYSTNALFYEMISRNTISSDTGILDSIVLFISSYSLGIKRLGILLFEVMILIYGIIVLRKEKFLWIFPALGLFNFIFCMVIFNPFITRTFGPILFFSIVTFAAVIMTHRPGIMKNLVLYAGFFYFLNNLAGDAYLFYKKSGNLSYKKLVERIDEKVPDNTTVASILEFWYAFPRNEFFCPYTNWEFKNYKDLEDLLQSNRLDYIVISDYLIRGFTATSERKEEVNPDDLIWYNSITAYANESALLIYEFDAMNYGNVKIWKVIK